MDRLAYIFHVISQRKMPEFPVSSRKFERCAQVSGRHSTMDLAALCYRKNKQKNAGVTTQKLTQLIVEHSV